MKRYLPVLWFLLLALAACGQETEEKAAYQLYFQEADLTFSAGEGAFRTERIFLDQEETEDSQHLAAALLEELLRGPLDETLKSTIPAGTTLLSMTLEGSRAVVDFSSPYGTLSGVSLTLADSAVLMTLAQVPEISSVRITVRGRDLAYRDRQVLFVRDVLLSPEEDVVGSVKALLYFPDSSGVLLPEARTLELYEGDTQVSAVAKALERGPENRSERLPALPEGFQVKSVWLEEDVCYVNFSPAQLEGLEEEVICTASLALGRSLCSLEGVEETRFLVGGEFSRTLETVEASGYRP